MIQGHKPAAELTTWDAQGRPIERDQLQCVHCQYVWTPKPGSGTVRGWCAHHYGWLCGRLECHRQQQRMLARMAALSGSTDRHCLAYTDYVNWQRDQLLKAGGWMATPSGVLVQTF